jgi:hypothetical protein
MSHAETPVCWQLGLREKNRSARAPADAMLCRGAELRMGTSPVYLILVREMGGLDTHRQLRAFVSSRSGVTSDDRRETYALVCTVCVWPPNSKFRI